MDDKDFMLNLLAKRSKEDGEALSALLSIVERIAIRNKIKIDLHEIDIVEELRKKLENRS